MGSCSGFARFDCTLMFICGIAPGFLDLAGPYTWREAIRSLYQGALIF